MSIWTKYLAVSLLQLFLIWCPLVGAHDGATGVVKDRMEMMDDMKESMKTLASIFKGDLPYDASKVQQAAEVLESRAGLELTKNFPKDSINGPSEAKTEIWLEWDRFESLADDLAIFSRALSNAADRRSVEGQGRPMNSSNMMDVNSMMGSDRMISGGKPTSEHLANMPADRLFKMVTDTRSSCHTRFRLEKDK